jgi:hypothetical protein
MIDMIHPAGFIQSIELPENIDEMKPPANDPMTPRTIVIKIPMCWRPGIESGRSRR